ncbi:MAG: glycogen debranching protein GlgX [Pseudomonadota bacterium]
MKQFNTRAGSRYPTGSAWTGNGANFSIFSRHAASVELLLYERADSRVPFQVIPLDPIANRTFFFWHVFVEGLPPGIHYTWRVDGPDDIRCSGFRFNKKTELLDPWAHAVTDSLWDRRKAVLHPGWGVPSMKAMVVDEDYDWQDDRPLNHPSENSIIYELNVGGFTRHPSAGVAHPGTFSGVIEKIPYLKELGVTDVELLPVMAFDEQDVPAGASALGLRNYWGYSSHSFFCPHPGYCVTPEKGAHLKEFRDMVKALHRAGIGVILDVVFNHTAEGGAPGPTINFKGIANEVFYHLDPHDRSVYLDYTGCGNTMNCNHPLVAAFIVDCLEFWVREMHVDGFRFDLASVLARGEDGNPLYHAPVLWNIEFSDVLAETRIIAEAWDAAGLYQVGAFPGYRWAEWNGRYRDVIRRFVRGDRGILGETATRITGSSDLYEAGGRLPINSVNFVTCHDGFTLNDLVSYNEKHNELNGEENRDGTNENLSWNCGREGETSDRTIKSFRRRQAANFTAILMLSHGVPMFPAGDEVLRTQLGNNNVYCQDNELGWFDWSLLEKNKDMLRFAGKMIAFRKRHPSLMRSRFLTGRAETGRGLPDIAWHGLKLNQPLWSDWNARLLVFTLAATDEWEEDLHVAFNMSDEPMRVEVPVLPDRRWYRAVDTSEPPPADILEPHQQPLVIAAGYLVRPKSVVVMESRPRSQAPVKGR